MGSGVYTPAGPVIRDSLPYLTSRGRPAELTPCSLPNSFSGSSEWNFLRAKGLVYVTITDSGQGRRALLRPGMGLVSFLEALRATLPHPPFSPSHALPQPESPVWHPVGTPARLCAPRWVPAVLGPFLP